MNRPSVEASSRALTIVRRSILLLVIVAPIVGPFAWYEFYYPIGYIAVLESEGEDVAKASSAFCSLSDIPLYSAVANSKYADFWDRRAVTVERSERAETAILYRMKALCYLDDDRRRRAIGTLIDRYGSRVTEGTRPLNRLVVTPDERTILTCGEDGIAKLWNSSNGSAIGRQIQHSAPITCAAFSPDGKRVATGADDGLVCLSLAASGERLGSPMRHPSAVHAVVFSADGDRLITGCDDGVVRAWDLRGEVTVGYTIRHDGPIVSVAVGANGASLLTASSDGVTQLSSVSNGGPLFPPLIHAERVFGASFCPNGTTVVVVSQSDVTGIVRLWDTSTGDCADLKHDSWVVTACVTMDGSHLATGCFDGSVYLWDAKTIPTRDTVFRHRRAVVAVAFSPSADTLFSASLDGTVHAASLGGVESSCETFEHEHPVSDLVVLAQGNKLVTASYDGFARLWLANAGTTLCPPMGHGNPITAIATNHPGTRVVVATSEGKVTLSTEEGETVGQAINSSDRVLCTTFKPDGSAYAFGTFGGRVYVRRASDNETLATLSQNVDAVRCLVFSSNGHMLLVGSRFGKATLWTIEDNTRRMLDTLEGVSVAAFNTTDSFVATGSTRGLIRLWKVVDGEKDGWSMEHSAPISALAFVSQGEFLVAGDNDGTVRLWDIRTGQQRGTQLSHPTRIEYITQLSNGIIVIATQRWAHLYHINEQLIHVRSELLPGAWKGQSNLQIDPDDPGRVKVILLTGTTFSTHVLFPESVGASVSGTPGALLEKWEHIFGVRR